jgi:stage IV sporulation protein FB
MFGMSETPFDLKFRFLDIPVRIHPFFWIVSAAMGWQPKNIPVVALWVACVFVSILVHEYGHALMAKWFDGAPSIMLWGLGGLCFSQGERTPRQRLAVIFSGPGAGFVLLGLVMVVTSLLCGITPAEQFRLIGGLFGLTRVPDEVVDKFQTVFHPGRGSEFPFNTYWFLVQINLVWGLVNLLPIWPLDGGQAAETVLSLYDRSQGKRWAHIVALLTAAGLAIMVYSITNPPDLYLTFFFGLFAVMNFQILHAIHQAQAMGMYRDDEWWRR